MLNMIVTPMPNPLFWIFLSLTMGGIALIFSWVLEWFEINIKRRKQGKQWLKPFTSYKKDYKEDKPK